MDYQQQLLVKKQRLKDILINFWQEEIEVFCSPEEFYRMRAEFRIWRDADNLYYAMSPKGEKISAKNVILLDNFPIATKVINVAMQKLLQILREEEVLANKLFQVEFLSSSIGDLLISLIYHHKLDQNWKIAAQQLEKQ